ncbi:MAG: glycosyltransferase family 4 protein [Actinomycetota bacterium]
MTTTRLIFQLGTNNWQRQGEFAPGSGILHEAHHQAYAAMPGTASWSIYPSQVQTSPADEPEVRVFELDHPIPICESVSPVSSYRFHSMSDDDFTAYVARLERFAEETIDAAEAAAGIPVTMAVAHHSFLNPLVLSSINRRRVEAGQPRFRLLCFVHGTALKMFAHEKAGVDPEYPARFLPFMEQAGVFEPGGEVDLCAAISGEQLEKFADSFPRYPRDRMVLSPNGYASTIFRPDPGATAERARILGELAPIGGGDSPAEHAPTAVDPDTDYVIVFTGKFADWKRLDALLRAAAVYEQSERLGRVTTLIIGSGPDEAIAHHHRLAHDELGLRRTHFLGPQPQPEIARLNALADLGVYPSRNEPFGLVFIEAMACGTPVIGADSGGPRDFVTDAVGGLVPEAEGTPFVTSLVTSIGEALAEDWKATKGPAAAAYAAANFSTDKQCADLVTALEAVDRQPAV